VRLLAGRLDSLIPIVVTATGSEPGWTKGSTRSMVVLWYERQPELLAALPAPMEARAARPRADASTPRTGIRPRAPIGGNGGKAPREESDGVKDHPPTENGRQRDERPSADRTIPEAIGLDSLGITPNPVMEQARISFVVGAPTLVTLRIHDMKGDPVLTIPPISCSTTGLWQIGCDLGTLRPGMYILRAVDRNGNAVTARFAISATTGE
jgi:hypothetical protein